MRTHLNTSRGFTLIELMVAVAIFAIVAMLASGAYLIMLDIDQRAQATTTGVDNLSFALESMTRTIRTGTHYNCGSPTGGDCGSGSVLYLTDQDGATVEFSLSGGAIDKTVGSPGVATPLTDPSVQITNLTFSVVGTAPYSAGGDTTQPYIFITVSGTTLAGPGKTVPFTVQTSAVMRGTDL